MNAEVVQSELLFATSNPHKVREVREILSPLGYRLLDLTALAEMPEEPVEDADSFQGNARLKARAYARSTGRRCLAEDSGLEVDALGGRPGVYSARYAGVGETRGERDQFNNEKLLAELSGVSEEQRAARFVCAMCVAEPDGRLVAESRGEFPGRIVDVPRGQNGFGYDPLLLVTELGRTSAELTPEEKSQRSHRGAALRALCRLLER